MLALGFLDRRRDFAVLVAIGAKPHQLAAFFWSEGLLITLAGVIFGVAIGSTTAWMLVKMLTGVFDPPPEHLEIPFLYLTALLLTIAASIGLAVAAARMKLVTVSRALEDVVTRYLWQQVQDLFVQLRHSPNQLRW